MQALLHHVQLSMTDVSRMPEMRRFYLETLGLREIPKEGETGTSSGFWIALDNHTELHIGLGAVLSDGRHHIALLVQNLDELQAKLSLAGFAIESAKHIPGRKRFFTRDPVGNKLEFMQVID